MRKLIIGAVAAVGLGGSALAADVPVGPVYKGPVAAPVLLYNWTGFYIGGHVGWGGAEKDWVQTTTNFPIPLDAAVGLAKPDGFLAGAQAGFNWQTGPWVLGIEGQWSWTDANGCSSHGGTPATAGPPAAFDFRGFAGCTNVNWYATVAGRVGYAWNNVLLYVKGGVAFADENHFITFRPTASAAPVVVTDNPGDTRTGWMVGAGIEYGFWSNWSVKIEYNYMDFGTENFIFNYNATCVTVGCATPGLIEGWDIDQKVHVVKFGINYRFGALLR